MRKTLALGVLALLVAAVGFLAARDRGTREAPPQPGADDASRGAEASSSSAHAPQTEVAVDAVGEAAATPAARRVIVRFVGEGLSPKEVVLRVEPDRDAERAVDLRFVDGRTSDVLPPAAVYEVVDAILDGWESNERFDEIEAGPDGPVELEVTLPVVPFIEVVGEGSGLPISQAFAMEGAESDRFFGGGDVPRVGRGRERFPADDVGRITLPKTTRTQPWWVGAPGRAWARVNVHPHQPRRWVALRPGGSLRVEVRSWEKLDEPRVLAWPHRRPDEAKDADDRWHRVRSLLRAAVLSETAVPGVLEIEGLRPGIWHVGVGPSDPNLWRDQVWAEADVLVIAGRTRSIRLSPPETTPRSPREKYRARITVTVPEAWEERPSRVFLSQQGGGIRFADVPGVEPGRPARFEVDGLVEGVYEIGVLPYRWERLFWVRGDREIELDVPPPVTVRARVVDAETDKPLPTAKVILWPLAQPTEEELPRGTREGTGAAGVTAARDPTTERFVARVFAGRVRVETSCRGYSGDSRTMDLDPTVPVQDLEFALDPAPTLTVRVLRDGTLDLGGSGEVTAARSGTVGDGGSFRREVRSFFHRGRWVWSPAEPGEWDLSVRWEGGTTSSAQRIRVPERGSLTVDFERGEQVSAPRRPSPPPLP